MHLSPYLNLDGRAEEAIKFYQKALDAKVEMMMRFKENPKPEVGMMPPGAGNKIMHANLQIGPHNLMLSDGQCTGKSTFTGVSLSLTVKSDAKAEKLFKALGTGGHVTMPMIATFYASRFGMVADKFGVHWMVLTNAPAKSAKATKPSKPKK